MISDIIDEAELKMDDAVEYAKEEFAAIRTGRAHPAMFNKLTAEYYGTPTPIQQLASFQVPDARMVLIAPYDLSAMSAIEKAIRDSDLGVNPTNDGTLIRIAIPQLTEERRKDLAKQARGKGEDAKVAIRNVRRKAVDELKRIQKDGEAGEDEVNRAEKDLDRTTAGYVAQVDDLVKNKENELLEV